MEKEKGPLERPRSEAIFEAEIGFYSVRHGWVKTSTRAPFEFFLIIMSFFFFIMVIPLLILSSSPWYVNAITIPMLLLLIIVSVNSWVRAVTKINLIIFDDGFFLGRVNILQYFQKTIPVYTWENLKQVDVYMKDKFQFTEESGYLSDKYFVINFMFINKIEKDAHLYDQAREALSILSTKVPDKLTTDAWKLLGVKPPLMEN